MCLLHVQITQMWYHVRVEADAAGYFGGHGIITVPLVVRTRTHAAAEDVQQQAWAPPKGWHAVVSGPCPVCLPAACGGHRGWVECGTAVQL